MPDIKAAITRPIGPLPAFAWVLVMVGGYVGYRFLSGRSSSSTSTTAQPTGASGIPSTDLSTQLANLTQVVSDLSNKTGGTGSTTGIIATLMSDTRIRLIDPATGKLVVPTQLTYVLGQPINTSRGPAHLVMQGGNTYELLDRNFTTAAATATTAAATAAGVASEVGISSNRNVIKTFRDVIASSATEPTPVADSTLALSNNTAMPRAVGSPITTPVVKAITSAAPTGLPSISKSPVATSTLRIPATTPVALPKVTKPKLIPTSTSRVAI